MALWSKKHCKSSSNQSKKRKSSKKRLKKTESFIILSLSDMSKEAKEMWAEVTVRERSEGMRRNFLWCGLNGKLHLLSRNLSLLPRLDSSSHFAGPKKTATNLPILNFEPSGFLEIVQFKIIKPSRWAKSSASWNISVFFVFSSSWYSRVLI